MTDDQMRNKIIERILDLDEQAAGQTMDDTERMLARAPLRDMTDDRLIATLEMAAIDANRTK